MVLDWIVLVCIVPEGLDDGGHDGVSLKGNGDDRDGAEGMGA